MVEAIRQGDIPGVQLRHRRRLDLTVEGAWEWLTRADRLEQWAADSVRIEDGESGTLRLESARDSMSPLVEEGETLERAEPHRWVLAFRQVESDWQAATRLTFELHPAEGGCELDILQQGFEHLSLSTCLTVWEEYRRRWRVATERLLALTALTH